jgi:hypothetical protein
MELYTYFFTILHRALREELRKSTVHRAAVESNMLYHAAKQILSSE